MKTLKIIIPIAFFTILHLSAQAQTTFTIEAFENNYQSCLDKGENMLGCSKAYYRQMDSVLDVVYKKLLLSLNKNQKAQLKSEQLEWLKKRDKYFQETKIEFNKHHPAINPSGEALGAQDDAMILYDQNAIFVKERVLTLINKLKKPL